MSPGQISVTSIKTLISVCAIDNGLLIFREDADVKVSLHVSSWLPLAASKVVSTRLAGGRILTLM